MTNKKLELTWIGKEKRPRLEPRILLEGPGKSYHAKHRVSDSDLFDNRLIFGDNLLALKALEQESTGKVKCVFIDPPFNTQQAFEHYDDGYEHSIWLGLIRDRAESLRRLMSDDGTLFVHIDDNELGYLIALLDEVFGRANRVSVVTFKQGSATGHKSINPGVASTTNFVLIYAKNKTAWTPKRVFTARAERDKRYGQFIENVDEPYRRWRFTTLTKAFARYLDIPERGIKKTLGDGFEEQLSEFVMKNASRVVRLARPDYKAVSSEARDMIDRSKLKPDEVLLLERDTHSDMYFVNGERVLFYSDKLKLIDGQYVAGEPLTSLWDDILSNNLHNEGGVEFPKGKKPEALIKRCLDLTTNSGDLVLDSFAGSGTTGAVAHRMGRRWIMVELGEHCHTHIIPRLNKVIDGADPAGVTAAMNWKGGGGFRYYKLAPSLIVNDRWGNPVINPEYNAAHLAEALCKLEGFSYAPSEVHWWQHGHSSERDFIYVTTQNLSAEQLQALSDELGLPPDPSAITPGIALPPASMQSSPASGRGESRSLLVCCAAFRGVTAAKACERWPNLTLKKIPRMVLARCEWGHDDYSLNVAALPMFDGPLAAPSPPASLPRAGEGRTSSKSRQTAAGQGGLFGEDEA
nr:K384 [uncultured bacterium]